MVLRILFVEDHLEFARTVTSEFLAGHAVTFAASVAEARARLVDGVFDVLLVDHDLPDGSGPQVIMHARALGVAAEVIAVSAHAEGNAALEAAGARARCPKGSFHEIVGLLATLAKA